MAKKKDREKTEKPEEKKQAGEKPKEKTKEKKPVKTMKQIVRIADKDLDGDKPLSRALADVKGISFSLAKVISKKAAQEMNINASAKLGSLKEEQLKQLSDIVIHPEKHGVPPFLLNRRKDRETGKNRHLTGHEVDFKTQEDIGMEKKVRSYKGVRHQLGLTVRGQRTRTSGRKGTTVGVQKTARMKKAQKR
jgi:small subunit ribosomal protein S13